MKVEKFKVIECIRQFILAEDKYLQNFPKKELEIRNKIKMNLMKCLK